MLEEYEKIKETTLEYLGRCIEEVGEMGCRDVARQLELYEHEIRSQRFNIAVVGDIKRGKSTLINTLLGQDNDCLSPIDIDICTGCIVHYMDVSCLPERETPHARVYTDGDPEPQRVELADIGEYIRESGNKDNWRNIDCIEIYGDFPLLHSCCLVDTPGANAVIKHHGELVNNFLPHADAIIMTVMASQPLTSSEARLVKNISENAQRRIFYLLTQTDAENPKDLPRICERVSRQIEQNGLHRPGSIFKVACKPVFDALCSHLPQEKIDELRSKWGVERLETELERFILQSSDSGKTLAKRAENATRLVRSFFQQRQKANRELAELHSADPGEMRDELARIKKLYQGLEKNIKDRIKSFEGGWDNNTQTVLARLAAVLKKLTGENLDAKHSLSNLYDLESLISDIWTDGQKPSGGNAYVSVCNELDENIRQDVQNFLKELSSGSQLSPGAPLAAASLVASVVSSAWLGGQSIEMADLVWLRQNAQYVSEECRKAITTKKRCDTARSVISVADVASEFIPHPVAKGVALIAKKIASQIVDLVDNHEQVKQALKEAIADIREESNAYKQEYRRALDKKMESVGADVEAQLEGVERIIAQLDSSVKEHALQENAELDELLELGTVICNQFHFA